MELQCLLEKGYTVINELNGFTDMKRHEGVLKINGLQILKKAKDVIHNLHDLINQFSAFLQNLISHVISDKVEILKSHSMEINECVQYISKLCMMAESVIKIKNPAVKKEKSRGLMEELAESLKQCEELRNIDYKGFVALDLDANLETLMKIPFVKISTRNSSTGGENELFKLQFSDMKDLDTFFKCSTSKNQLASKEDEVDSGYGFESGNSSSNKTKAFPFLKEAKNSQNIRPKTLHAVSSLSIVESVETQKTQVKQEVITPVTKKENPFTTSCSKENAEIGTFKEELKPQISKSERRDRQCSTSACNRKDGKLFDDEPSIASEFDSDQRMQTHCTRRNTVEMEDDEIRCIKVAIGSKDKLMKPSVEKDSSNSYPVKQSVGGKNNSSSCSADTKESNHNRSIASKSEQKQQEQVKGVFTSQSQTEAVKHKQNSRAKPVDKSEPQKANNSGQVCARGDFPFGVQQQTVVSSFSNVNSSVTRKLPTTLNLQSLITFDRQGMPFIQAAFVTTLNGGSSPFSHPTGLVVNSLGQVIVADTGNNLVKVMDGNKVILTIEEGYRKFSRPSAVVTDSSNNIYVKDDRCIQVFDCVGRKLRSAGFGVLRNPYGLAMAQHNGSPFAVFVDSNSKTPCVYHYHIEKDNFQTYPYDPLLPNAPIKSKVRFLAVHNDVMLASDLGCSVMYLTYLNGKVLKVFSSFGNGCGQVNEPSGVTCDAFGNWLVADSRNNRVQAFTRDGKFLALLNLSCLIKRPSGIHLTPQGNLFIINYLHGVIDVYRLH